MPPHCRAKRRQVTEGAKAVRPNRKSENVDSSFVFRRRDGEKEGNPNDGTKRQVYIKCPMPGYVLGECPA